MKKYLCIGTSNVASEWLPRWYGVPFDECLFPVKHNRVCDFKYNCMLNTIRECTYSGTCKKEQLIILKPIPNGDYKQHLKILKTERLLNGE